MKFLVKYEYRGASYYEQHCSGRRVAQLKKMYYVYEVTLEK